MMLFLAVSFVFEGEEDSRLCFCFFMLRKKRGGNVYGIYAMAASGRMQYDYKQTNILLGTSVSWGMVDLFTNKTIWCMGRPVGQPENLAFRLEHIYTSEGAR
jgi:hypothetical protein